MDNHKEITVSAFKANFYAILMMFPIIGLTGIPYLYLWGDGSFESVVGGSRFIMESESLFIVIFFTIFLTGIFLHELIHAVFWARSCKSGFRSIKFGIKWKALAPYTHCTESMDISAYRTGVIMPGLILGILPSALGLSSGNLFMVIFGITFTCAAGGDIIILWLLRNVPPETLVQDHNDKIGCYIVNPDFIS
jgi:hypothetical protein